jgi:hypothetical protein
MLKYKIINIKVFNNVTSNPHKVYQIMTKTPIQKVSDSDLIKFLEHSEELEKSFRIERHEFDSKWIKAKYDIASSASYIYIFTGKLIREIKNNSQEFAKDIKNARYYFFYIDMILAKLSNTVFTETPKTAQLDILSRSAKEIAIIGENLLYIAQNSYNKDRTLNKDTESINNKEYFDTHFQRYFLKVFTLFDFAYSGKVGVFTRFTLNKELYEKNKLYLKEIDNNQKKLSQFLQYSLVKNIENSLNIPNKHLLKLKKLNFTSSPKILTIQDFQYQWIELCKKSNINHLKTYKDFVKRNENIATPVEVFSYILSSKLWRFTKYLHDTPEYINKNTKDESILEFNKKITAYTKKNLSFIDNYYHQKTTNLEYFSQVATLDEKFIKDSIFDSILMKYTKNTTQSIKIQIPDRNKSPNLFITPLTQQDEKKHSLSKLVTYMIENKKDEKFKYYRIFEKGSAEEIAWSIEYLYTDIENTIDSDKLKNTHFLGLLRSGSFLAHALTIINWYKNNAKYQIASSILTYPYISLEPREIFDRDNGNERHIIYIDEAVKSQFSLSIADTYRKRVLYFHDIPIEDREDAFALVNFKKYHSLNMKKSVSPKIHSSMDIDIISDNGKSYISTDKKVTNHHPKNIFQWKDFFKELKSNTITDLKKEVYDYSIINNDALEKRLDITKVISNSFLLFKIATFFATKINELNIEEKNIIFFHGCSEAKILTDSIVFAYKHLYSESSNHKEFILESKQISKDKKLETIKKSYRLFIDITLDVGTTRNQIKRFDLEEAFQNTKIDFNHTFIIASRKKQTNSSHIILFNKEMDL